MYYFYLFFFFFSSRRRHTRSLRDWSSDVCSSDLAKRFKVLVAVEQPQAVHGGLIAISVVVAQLEFPEGLVFLAQSHQSDSKRGMCRPQPWLKLDRFAVVRDGVLIPVVQSELTPDPS